MNEFLPSLRVWLSVELFRISGTPVTAWTLISVVAIIVISFWISSALRRGVERVLTWRGERPAFIGTVKGLIHYSVLITGFSAALSAAGIDLTALFAAGAIFAVGLGFAMQSIAQNFVAGIILLTERSIKPGDILEVEGKLVQLKEMGIRSSVAHTRDGEDLIIPNATLIQTTVKNFTFEDSTYRIRANIGVTYGSDMRLVKATLDGVARTISDKWAVEKRAPQVILTEFGAHAVQWEVAIWMTDPWHARPALSDLHESLWWALKQADIVIAFPQLDVHFDPAVARALERLAGTGRAHPSMNAPATEQP